MTKVESEYDKFESLTRELLKVPHSEIKAKLEAEKRAKKLKRKSKRTTASMRK